MAPLHCTGIGMAKGSRGWRAEQGHRESPASHCLARRGLRTSHPLDDSEGSEGKRCAFFSRKSEDIKGRCLWAFATLVIGRSCGLCYLGIVFGRVSHAQRKRASVDSEAGTC